MADVGLYVFGTSILWGQGHEDPNKIHRRVERWLVNRGNSVMLRRHAAHSGAVLLGSDGKKRGPLFGEIPDPWPSVATQIRKAKNFTSDKRRIVLVDGGINDVGVFTIVNPATKPAAIKKATKQACRTDLEKVLKQIAVKYAGAEIYVLGYFQILAKHIKSNAKLLEDMLVRLNICQQKDLAGDFVGKAVANTRVFRDESDKHIAAAAAAAGATFVPSGFGPNEGLFSQESLLFRPFANDPMFDDRIIPCAVAGLQGRSGAHCPFASTGHPRTSGVIRYVKSLKAHIG